MAEGRGEGWKIPNCMTSLMNDPSHRFTLDPEVWHAIWWRNCQLDGILAMWDVDTRSHLTALQGDGKTWGMAAHSQSIIFMPEGINYAAFTAVFLEVEIVSDAALKLCYCKLTVTRTDVYGGILWIDSMPIVWDFSLYVSDINWWIGVGKSDLQRA